MRGEVWTAMFADTVLAKVPTEHKLSSLLSILTPYRRFLFRAVLKRTDGIIGLCATQTANVHSTSEVLQSVSGVRC
jgi:hypothetical protein